MIDHLRALLKPAKGKKQPSAAELATALESGQGERAAALAKLGELRESMGPLLLDGDAEELQAREKEIDNAERDLKRWDAVLAALEERRANAEQSEESTRIDGAISRAAKLVKSGKTLIAEYEAQARAVAATLQKLERIHSDWQELSHEIGRAGRETDLVLALDGDGAAVHGPSFVRGLSGGLIGRGSVQLPSVAEREWLPLWGNQKREPPADPPAPSEPDPMGLVHKHLPNVGAVWRLGEDGQHRDSYYHQTREELIARAEALEAASESASVLAIH